MGNVDQAIAQCAIAVGLDTDPVLFTDVFCEYSSVSHKGLPASISLDGTGQHDRAPMNCSLHHICKVSLHAPEVVHAGDEKYDGYSGGQENRWSRCGSSP